MSSTRMKGSALSLSFDGVDYWADVTQVRLINVALGVPLRRYDGTIADSPRRFLIKGAAIQSLQASSFWRYAWDNAGKIIDFRYAPLGNHAALPDATHFVGSVQLGPRPTAGGDAGTAEFEFDFEWEVLGTPDIDDGSSPSHNE